MLMVTSLDPEIACRTAFAALSALDRILSAQAPDDLLPAGDIAALVRLICAAAADGLANARSAND